MIAQMILSFYIVIPPWKYNLILFNVSCCLCCSNTTTTTFRILQYSLCPFVFNWWMGETRIKKTKNYSKGGGEVTKVWNERRRTHMESWGHEAAECSLLQLLFIQQISCRNMDELIWQVETQMKEYNSAEKWTRKQFCLNSTSHKHHHNFRPDQIAYKEQTLLHAIIVQLSEKSLALAHYFILFF